MSDGVANSGTSQVQGQASAATVDKTGQPETAKAGQPAGKAAASVEDLEKAYKELQSKFNQRDKEISELRKDAETMQFLRGDPRFVDFATNTYGGKTSQTPQTVESNNSIEEDEEIIGLTKSQLEKLVEEKAQRVLQNDPLRQYVQEQAVEIEFGRTEQKGFKDVRNYKPKIAEWYRKNPGRDLSIEEVYKLVVFEDLQGKLNTNVAAASNADAKRAASTEGPGMSVASTTPQIKTLMDAVNYAKQKHGVEKLI